MDKVEAAKVLARKHYEIEPGITRIFRITSEADALPTEPIKLLEVNEDTVPSGILPLHFGPLPVYGIPYASVIIEITPDEFEKLQAHQLALPAGGSPKRCCARRKPPEPPDGHGRRMDRCLRPIWFPGFPPADLRGRRFF